jgi:hypothetical protein
MLFEHQAVSLRGLAYTFTPRATPCQILCRYIQRELGLALVSGAELAKVRVPVLVNPVRLEQLTLSLADHHLLAQLTRAWALAAVRGDVEAERRLWWARAMDPPYIASHVPVGVAYYYADL